MCPGVEHPLEALLARGSSGSVGEVDAAQGWFTRGLLGSAGTPRSYFSLEHKNVHPVKAPGQQQAAFVVSAHHWGHTAMKPCPYSRAAVLSWAAPRQAPSHQCPGTQTCCFCTKRPCHTSHYIKVSQLARPDLTQAQQGCLTLGLSEFGR